MGTFGEIWRSPLHVDLDVKLVPPLKPHCPGRDPRGPEYSRLGVKLLCCSAWCLSRLCGFSGPEFLSTVNDKSILRWIKDKGEGGVYMDLDYHYYSK